MSKKPVIIVFIGPVGAGKTTHILAAFNALERRGYRVHKTYVKTTFFTAMLLGRLRLLRGAIWRFAVALDLLSNSILLPLVLWLRVVLVPLIMRKRVVLVEEHLPGSLVDYIDAALLLNLTPMVLPALKILFKLSRASIWSGIIYAFCDRKLLPQRWTRRGTPPEMKIYLLIQNLVFAILLKTLNRRDLLLIDTSKDFHYNIYEIFEFVLRKLWKT
jgi:GTPase SAR1 family protein